MLIRLGLNYKRLQEWQKAVAVWQRIIAELAFHPLPYIELAKHLEHREKDFKEAQRLVEKALRELEVLASLNRLMAWQEYREDLERRRTRLENRI